MKPRIVVVGGGFAGFWAAASARRVGGDLVDITLVSAGPSLQIRPRLYEAHPETLAVELAPLLALIDVTFVIDQVMSVDLAARSLTLRQNPPIAYDRLVMAVGSVMRRPNVPGAEHAWSIDNQDAAVEFDAILAEVASNDRRDPISIAVVGAGFTGIELALELRDRVALHTTTDGVQHGLPPSEALKVTLIDRTAQPGLELGPNPQALILSALSEARVVTRLGASIVAMSATSITFANGEVAHYDAVVLATGLGAAPLVAEIPGERDPLGRIVVERSLRALEAPEVFVTGDAAAADTGDGHLALQSCQHALQLGRVAGENAAHDLLGQPTIDYEQLRYVTCLDLGRSGAVLTSGWDRQVVMSGEDAKSLKRGINTSVIYPPIDATREMLLELSRTTPTALTKEP